MLRWMIFDGEVTPYFSGGKILPRATVASILLTEKIDAFGPLAERDEAVRKRFNAEYADRIVGRHYMEYVDDDPVEWNGSGEPHAVGAGFFVYADSIDWEAGSLFADIPDPSLGDLEHLFWDAEDHLASMFAKADFKAELSGLCFPSDVIELLQPSADICAVSQRIAATEHRVGRPRSWDWEGALTHLIGLAQHPDGLPTGPGAQAQVEQLIAEWFVTQVGNSPSSSQIRTWAQKVMSAVKA